MQTKLKEQEKEVNKYYELRKVSLNDAEEATAVEAVCFPPNEACTLSIMKERISRAADTFLTAIDRENGNMVGFVNGLCTNESSLRDELFTDTSLHDSNGENVMIDRKSVV